MRSYLTVPDVEGIHRQVLEETGGLPGYLDKGRIDAAVNRLHTGYYNNVFEEAAALMESLANNHGFVDGNKRTAFVSTDTFLRRNGFYMEVEPVEAHNLITNAMAEKVFKYGLILEWVLEKYEILVHPT
jgi:death on curing protein